MLILVIYHDDVRLQHNSTSQSAWLSGLSFRCWRLLVQIPYPKIRSLVHICRKLAASLRHTVAASLLQTRFSYANYFSGALLWPTMCAASMQRTVVAHCFCTQCAPQICSAQLSRTVLAHNVRRKFAAHSCRALFWHTMCAASLQRTVVAHCSGTQYMCATSLWRKVAVHCAVLPPPPVYHPIPIFF